MVFSLIESKLILPAHLKHVRLHEHGGHANRFEAWQSRFADGFEGLVDKYYRPALAYCLHHRYSTLATFSGVLIILVMLVLSGWTRFVPFPAVEGETATASLTMPVGTPFSVTNRHAERIEAAARQLQEKYVDPDTGESMIVNMLATVGARGRSTGSHLARVQFETVPRQHRTIEFSMRDVTNEWRNLIGEVPGAESLNFRSSWFRAGDPIDVRFSGNSLETLQSVGDETKRYLATLPGVFEIADSLSDGKEELQIELSPQGYLLGLTRSEIVRQVGQAFLGLQAQRIQRGRDDVRVLVRYPIEERRTLASLQELLITAPDGRLVPLANVATVKPGRGPSTITRINGYRVLNVTADIDKSTVNTVVLFAELQQYLDELLVKYPGITYSFEGEQARQAETFGSLGIGIVVVLFVIYCMLALPLKSYTQPLIVMSVIPFGIIGAVIGHWLMGVTLTILSSLGLMALIGVVVNDSLVLVDFVNQRHRDRGQKLIEAVKSAGPVRFRPVMLTSLTTFFGLTPLLMDQSSSAQFLVPMAISLAFGILFATAITLILVPTNLVIADDVARFFRRKASEVSGSLAADPASRETS